MKKMHTVTLSVIIAAAIVSQKAIADDTTLTESEASDLSGIVKLDSIVTPESKKTVYTYADGENEYETVDYFWVGNSWMPVRKTQHKSKTKNITEETQYVWRDGSWHISFHTTQNTPQTDRGLTVVEDVYYDDNGEWASSASGIFSHGHQVKYTEHTLDDNGNKYKYMTIAFSYDSEWNQTSYKAVYYAPDGMAINTIGHKTEKAYSPTGKLLSSVYYTWNEDKNGMVPSVKYEYVYSENDEAIAKYTYSWSNLTSDWINAYRDLYEYTYNADMTIASMHTHNGYYSQKEWIEEVAYTEYTYDSEGNRACAYNYSATPDKDNNSYVYNLQSKTLYVPTLIDEEKGKREYAEITSAIEKKDDVMHDCRNITFEHYDSHGNITEQSSLVFNEELQDYEYAARHLYSYDEYGEIVSEKTTVNGNNGSSSTTKEYIRNYDAENILGTSDLHPVEKIVSSNSNTPATTYYYSSGKEEADCIAVADNNSLFKLADGTIRFNDNAKHDIRIYDIKGCLIMSTYADGSVALPANHGILIIKIDKEKTIKTKQ